ncbi:hypothetical protein RIR_jg16345.t1 [Rhizophagus irregularis DAOM 181602=DAOM 197198]|nr:hypothetical protein RIR_jg16345.t1 [Rhizophagus irregularis DAOM 181602=DAOM 197198]
MFPAQWEIIYYDVEENIILIIDNNDFIDIPSDLNIPGLKKRINYVSNYCAKENIFVELMQCVKLTNF